MPYALKILTTSLLIVAISELAKYSTFLGALLASIPLISVLTMSWLAIPALLFFYPIALVVASGRFIFIGHVTWLLLPPPQPTPQ